MKDIHAYPMHGYHKWLAEGFRTRDAHIVEWFTKLIKPGESRIRVHSRPDPIPMRLLALRGARDKAPIPGTTDEHRDVLAVPPIRDPKQWWKKSVKHFLPLPVDAPMVVWNPMVGLRPELQSVKGPVHFDLLDDWTVHQAFQSIRSHVLDAYREMFSVATSVTANSEATLELARSYGRNDAVLVPNGCDPARFSSVSEASGPITVGYVGKIGNRLDAKLIGDTVTAIPQVNFVFAGPVLEREVLSTFAHKPNVRMLGDIHYEDVPKLLQTFDIGWVPHGVESGQVGGDAIKIYEYRAAGLPVVTTPIIGTRERPMPYVNIAESTQHTDTITRLTAGYSRVPRVVSDIPFDMTWESKAQYMLNQLA